MSLDFLKNNGARRIREFDPQPQLLTENIPMSEDENECVDLEYETKSDWKPRCVQGAEYSDVAQMPRRFVDGKDVGRVVAWLQSEGGSPVPIRVSEIGAACLRSHQTENGEIGLTREWSQVERVVSLMTDLFPWDEVEEFAGALSEVGFRLLPVLLREDEWHDGFLWDFERTRKRTHDRSKDEMIRCEREALSRDFDAPTIVDGNLDARASAFDEDAHVLGIVKSHYRNYLGAQNWRTFYELEPCQRTPAFTIGCKNLEVVSWYVRLDGANGEMPNFGIVRVETPRPFFENVMGKDFDYLDRVSRLICKYRCRDEGYGRASVTIHPIRRVEESLGALMTNSDTLISRFYRLTGL